MTVTAVFLVIFLTITGIHWTQAKKEYHLSDLINSVDEILPSSDSLIVLNPCYCQNELDGIYYTVCQIYNDITEISCEVDDIEKILGQIEQYTCDQHSILSSLSYEIAQIKQNQTDLITLLDEQTTILENIVVNLEEIKDADKKIEDCIAQQTSHINNLHQIVLEIDICLK
ncbi:uncharacterized protein [Diabrotica undecimpunctata]|uniref:uncharacterized protein n=1 Tax=Diabrotica undecimpunctata TaxID=50387 RepID=UPI003B63E8C6